MQKSRNPHIAVDRSTYEVIRQIAFECGMTLGQVVAEKFDPRTLDEREQDAEVTPTPEPQP